MKSNQQQLWRKDVCLIIKEQPGQYQKKGVGILVAGYVRLFSPLHTPAAAHSDTCSQQLHSPGVALAELPLLLSSAYSKLRILQRPPCVEVYPDSTHWPPLPLDISVTNHLSLPLSIQTLQAFLTSHQHPIPPRC